MPLSYTILPPLGIVYVRYDGEARLEETMEVFGRYAADPDFRPGLTQLVDLSRVTEFERDFMTLARSQAGKADTMTGLRTPTLAVYYAPTQVGQEMAQQILKSWDGLDAVIVRIATDEAQALEMLGLEISRFSDLPGYA